MFILLFSLFSSAGACTYVLNQTQIHISDRTVHFGDYLNQKLFAKGYLLAMEGEDINYKVNLDFQLLVKSHFEYAHSNVSIQRVSDSSGFYREVSVRCYTQSCIAKDAAKAIRKSIDDFSSALPACVN